MMMLLLAKIVKLAWFDDAEVKNAVVPQLTKILHKQNPRHKLIGLKAIDQLLVEMSYMTKMRNLAVNRRISLSFRDTALFEIFTNNLTYIAKLVEQIEIEFASNNQRNIDVILDSLEVCLETYHKCLTFDFIAVLLNETLDEPSQINLPSSWTTYVENPQTINALFYLCKLVLQKIPFVCRNISQASE